MSAPAHVNSGRALAPPSSSTETVRCSKRALSSWYHISHEA